MDDLLQWKPMETAPRDGSYIAVLYVNRHKNDPAYNEAMIVQWDSEEDGGCWWLPEGAAFSDDQLAGWFPIPPIK